MFLGEAVHANEIMSEDYENYIGSIRKTRGGCGPVVTVNMEMTEFLFFEGMEGGSYNSIIHLKNVFIVGSSDSVLVFDDTDLQLLKILKGHKEIVRKLIVQSEKQFISCSDTEIIAWEMSYPEYIQINVREHSVTKITSILRVEDNMYIFGDLGGSIMGLDKKFHRLFLCGGNISLLNNITAMTSSQAHEKCIYVAGRIADGDGPNNYYRRESGWGVNLFNYDIRECRKTIFGEGIDGMNPVEKIHTKSIISLTSFIDCNNNEILITSSGSSCQRIAFWNTQSSKLLKVVKKFGPRGFLTSKRGRILLTASYNVIGFWDLEKLRCLKEVKCFEKDAVRSICWFGENNEKICCGSRDGMLKIIDSFDIYEGDSIDIDLQDRKMFIFEQEDWMDCRLVCFNVVMDISNFFLSL